MFLGYHYPHQSFEHKNAFYQLLNLDRFKCLTIRTQSCSEKKTEKKYETLRN